MQVKKWLMCVPVGLLLLGSGPALAQSTQQPPPTEETDRQRREREERARKERDELHQKQTRDGLAGRALDDPGGRLESRRKLERDLLTVSEIDETARGMVVPLDGSLFEAGSTELAPQAQERVEKIGRLLSTRQNARFQVLGYTDAADDDAERSLAERRAQAIRDLLVAAGVSGGQISASSVRDSRAMVTSDTTSERLRNRRVEIVVVEPGTIPVRP